MFPPDKDDKEYDISLKKILKKEAAWETIKNVLGFEFYGNLGEHTKCFTEERCTYILIKLKKWIRKGEHRKGGTPFEEF